MTLRARELRIVLKSLAASVIREGIRVRDTTTNHVRDYTVFDDSKISNRRTIPSGPDSMV